MGGGGLLFRVLFFFILEICELGFLRGLVGVRVDMGRGFLGYGCVFCGLGEWCVCRFAVFYF